MSFGNDELRILKRIIIIGLILVLSHIFLTILTIYELTNYKYNNFYPGKLINNLYILKVIIILFSLFILRKYLKILSTKDSDITRLTFIRSAITKLIIGYSGIYLIILVPDKHVSYINNILDMTVFIFEIFLNIFIFIFLKNEKKIWVISNLVYFLGVFIKVSTIIYNIIGRLIITYCEIFEVSNEDYIGFYQLLGIFYPKVRIIINTSIVSIFLSIFVLVYFIDRLFLVLKQN